MFAIRKSILPGLRGMRRQLDLQLKSEIVSPSFWGRGGSTLTGSFTQKRSSIPGGACELGGGPRTSAGVWTTSW